MSFNLNDILTEVYDRCPQWAGLTGVVKFREGAEGFLVGNDGSVHPRRADIAQKRLNAVVGACMVGTVRGIIRREALVDADDLLLRCPGRNGAFDELADAVSDEAAHLRKGSLRHGVCAQCGIRRLVQIVEGIEDGSVQIKNSKLVLHKQLLSSLSL